MENWLDSSSIFFVVNKKNLWNFIVAEKCFIQIRNWIRKKHWELESEISNWAELEFAKLKAEMNRPTEAPPKTTKSF